MKTQQDFFRFGISYPEFPGFYDFHERNLHGSHEPLISSPAFKIVTLKPRMRKFFLGYFLIEPRQEMKTYQVPKADLVFLEPLCGELDIFLPDREIHLQKAESFFFDGKKLEYRLSNRGSQTNKILAATFPSFIAS